MEPKGPRQIFRVEKGRMHPKERAVVQEFPVRLTVNNRELATLIASPHQLNFLVVGFLRNQGFIHSLDDLSTLGVCDDFGAARAQIKGELPQQLKPTLTSGCGTGITFTMPSPADASCGKGVLRRQSWRPEAIHNLMKDLYAQAENYRSHGGIHSAAVGDGDQLLLYAEDIGRHNTLDRLAGEALFKNIDLTGKMLVTSGRVSTEMVAKAMRLGIALIASRTSPTDMAIEMAEQAGITLIGYVRNDSFEVYTHPQGIEEGVEAAQTSAAPAIPGVTGVILAGGESRRMGCNKSLLPLNGARFIDHIYRQLQPLFDEVLIVTNCPELYAEIPCRKVPDIYYAQGSLAGIHSGVCHARHERIFVVGCDMPFIYTEIIKLLCAQAPDSDVVIPKRGQNLEPLHALYHKRCLAAMEKVLDSGKKRIIGFFPEVQVTEVAEAQWRALDSEGKTFLNINTPQEYFSLRDKKQAHAHREAADTVYFCIN